MSQPPDDPLLRTVRASWGPESFANGFQIFVGTLRSGMLPWLVLLCGIPLGLFVWECHFKQLGPLDTLTWLLSTEREQEDQEFVDSTARRARFLKIDLQMTVTADVEINRILARMVKITPGAARAVFAIVHDGVYTLTPEQHQMRFSVVNSQAAPGRSVGDLVQNQPISAWSDFLPKIVKQPACIVVRRDQITVSSVLEQMNGLGTVAFIVCSVFSDDQYAGNVSVGFEREEDVPSGAALDKVLDDMLVDANEIGLVLGVVPRTH